jgi:1-acyl-sn-glycerol-3-phosphate acyltransferase
VIASRKQVDPAFLSDSVPGKKVLLTGATGFVGKVALFELVRRKEELGIDEIHLVIRKSKREEARARFVRLAASPCFADLPAGWDAICRVVEADLGDAHALPRRAALAAQITHIVHCAASVEFDLPVAEAAAANITSALNVVAFAKRCPNLSRMVSVSTAYVTPHPGDGVPVHEVLAPLPRPARVLYDEMRTGGGPELDARLLAESGHPNTYTLSKCVAEHLLMEEKQAIPLTIVRPSIVSACVAQPFPGWIDSRAAFAGFVALIGMGHLRAVNVDPRSALDIVPCDEVTRRLIDCAFLHDDATGTIRYAVAGRRHSNSIETNCRIILDYFARHPEERRAVLHWKGSRGWRFEAHDLFHHRAPLRVLGTVAALTGRKKAAKAARRLHDSIQQLHDAFPYFTHNTFDFRASLPLPATFDREAYIDGCCAGIGRHLLGRDPRRARLAGRRDTRGGDLRFAARQPHGNLTLRALAYLVKKGLRACVEEVTFDYPSFEAALDEVPRDALVVIVPTHRSYMDFLLAPLLFFARPELGVRPPKIAAAEEFSRIPVLGKVFAGAGAFYIKRGVGRASMKLNEQIASLVEGGETLMFFIEGKRSRDRRFLAPKTGLLRSLAGTDQRFVLLPVSISYDRVPEEGAMLDELRSGEKQEMRLVPLLGWIGRALRGGVKLGHVHMSCGRPVHLAPGDDVHAVAREVMGELQRRTVTTTHHLEAFLQAAGPRARGLDLPWLRAAIVARGGEVVDSSLAVEEVLEPDAARCLYRMFDHLFYPDALARFADHPQVVSQIEREHFRDKPVAIDARSDSDPRLETLLDLLFNAAEPAKLERSEPRSTSMFSLLRELVGVPERPRA